VIDLVLEVFDGQIDTDPCADPEKTVPAVHHYTEGGLEKPWFDKVYANPPYGKGLGEWIKKAIEEYEAGAASEIILLLPQHSERPYYDRLRKFDRCEAQGQLKFKHGDGKHKGEFRKMPWGSVIFYLGPNRGNFYRIFSKIGLVLAPLYSDEVANQVFAATEISVGP
jgi:hypothetical protein